MKKVFINCIFILLASLAAVSSPLFAQTIVDSRMSGGWYDPDHTGEGFVLEVLEDGRAVIYWFTYDESGAQRWFIGVGEVSGDKMVVDELLAGSGGVFGDVFDPDDVVLANIGALTVTWSNCSEAFAEYTVDGVDGTQNLERLTHVAGMECDVPVTEASAKTGSWYDNTHVGEGLAIEIINDGRALVYWFSYNAEGKPAWFFGVGEVDGESIIIDEMYITSGGRFGSDFNPDDVELESWGSTAIELGCDFGKLDYLSEISEFGSGKQTMVRLTNLADAGCEEPPPPNILLVIADDLGLDASNQYGLGSEAPLTPTLDDIANNGVIFENAWSYPTCTPTRSSILTGKYGAHTGVFEVGDVLSTDETSLQSYIRQHLPGKYQDAVIGKWHVGPGRDVTHPTDMGIGYYAGLISGGVAAYDNWQLTLNGEQTTETQYVTSKLVDLAIDWTAAQEDPWFLWLAFNAPHTPFHLPPGNLHDRDLPGTEADINANPLPYYLAAIEAMDTELGRLLDSMDEETRENTIIIFIGDNGTPSQVAQAPFSRMKAKGSLYQGGINIPMFVSTPGALRTGERESALVNTTDLFSTIASFTGVNVSTTNDSISFAGLLDGEREDSRPFQYAETMSDNEYEWTVSDGEFKLIKSSNGGLELYDLGTDPFENDDLVARGSVPEGKVEELQALVTNIQPQD